MATQQQVAANRRNGRKGGVKSEAGRNVSRLNAQKHGVFASALTAYDQAGLRTIYEELAEWMKPVGPVERMLTEMVALNYLRLQRCARAEAEYHVDTWEPKEVASLRERRNSFSPRTFKESVELFGRYNTMLTNQVVKLLHELERLRRMREGEEVAAPVVAEVTVSAAESELRNKPNLAQETAETGVTTDDGCNTRQDKVLRQGPGSIEGQMGNDQKDCGNERDYGDAGRTRTNTDAHGHA